MYKTILVKEIIDEGSRLLELLKRNNFHLNAALWHFVPDSNQQWVLVIVSPVVDQIGPLAAYGRLQRLLGMLRPASRLSLSDISLISPLSQEYQNLRSLVSGAGRLGIGAAAGPIRDVTFEDAYVYQL